jgi:hypothetical protein
MSYKARVAGGSAEPFDHEQAYRRGRETAQRLVDAVNDESMKLESGISVNQGGFDDFLREIPLFADLDPRALSERERAISQGTRVSSASPSWRHAAPKAMERVRAWKQSPSQNDD